MTTVLMASDRCATAKEVQTAPTRRSESENALLAGIFAPVQSEVTAHDLPVVGELPPELQGMFVRNGPNPLIPPTKNYHWFDGDGMLHGVRISDGRASYLNRYVRTASWKRQTASGRRHGLSLNAGPIEIAKSFWDSLRHGKLDVANKANTALVSHHGKLFALWEAGAPHEIKPDDLQTVGPALFEGLLRHGFTAHPKIDPVTGELVFFGYSPRSSDIQYGVLDPQGSISHLTTVPLGRSVMMHDCAITGRYTVFLDFPLVINPLRTLVGKPAYAYRPELGARFGVLERYAEGSQTRWFEVQPGFVFHALNAWEEDECIVVHGCRFPEPPSLMRQKQVRGHELTLDAVMYRWRINLATGQVSEGPLDDVPVEFPRLDDALIGSKNRFGYAASILQREQSALIKYELGDGSSVRHELGCGRMAGEGVFVPRSGRVDEDDGYLLSLLHDEAEERSELIVINCRQFDQPPIARVLLPQRVPAGFHGAWLDDALEE